MTMFRNNPQNEEMRFRTFHTYSTISLCLCLFQAEEMCFRTFHTYSTISYRGHHSAAGGHGVVPSFVLDGVVSSSLPSPAIINAVIRGVGGPHQC